MEVQGVKAPGHIDKIGPGRAHRTQGLHRGRILKQSQKPGDPPFGDHFKDHIGLGDAPLRQAIGAVADHHPHRLLGNAVFRHAGFQPGEGIDGPLGNFRLRLFGFFYGGRSGFLLGLFRRGIAFLQKGAAGKQQGKEKTKGHKSGTHQKTSLVFLFIPQRIFQPAGFSECRCTPIRRSDGNFPPPRRTGGCSSPAHPWRAPFPGDR